jgi:hypothetical protein
MAQTKTTQSKARTAKKRTSKAPGSKARSPKARTANKPGARARRGSSSGARKAASGVRRWSKHVTETSNALDLEPNIFSKGTARQIALSLRRSAEHSQRRKSSPFRAAMSMLTFYINRSGKNESPARLRVLNRAKDELRDVFQRSRAT